MSRLPTPGRDDGTWGTILNDFLDVAHNPDGTLKASGVIASKADDTAVVHNTGNESISGTKTFQASPVVPTPTLGSQAANKSYVDSTVSAGAPDASPTTKGIVQLTGDLGGTATSPTVPGLTGKATDTAVVHKATTETITGAKDFTGGLTANGTNVVVTSDSRLTDQRVPMDGSVTNAKLSLTGGNNDQVLTKDSAQTGGIKWASFTATSPWATVAVWSSVTTYTAGPPASVVTYNGGTYIALATSANVTPGTDSTKWAQLAAPGPAGPAGPTGLTLRGTYNNATTYGINDCVTYNGSAYYASAGTTGVNPGTPGAPNSPWVLFVSIGSQGATGPAGSSYPGPGDQGLIAWDYDPAMIAANAAPPAGVILLAKISISANTTLTNILIYVGTIGASLTVNANYAALYNASGTLLSTTADQSSVWTTLGLKTMALTTPQSVTAGYYYLSVLANGTTIPQFGRASAAAPNAAVNAGVTSANPRQASYGSGLTSMPSTITLTSSLTSNIVSWMAVN
ncbi:MAG: hypothetical protein JWP06_691 [Candidatus Saccharibacteria bacterium]|nr:hypothetical protein [Candidatus Saccharibacteria bacterium]